MSVDSPRAWWQRLPPAIDLAQYAMLAFIVTSALAGAFTHMHDWTIREIDAALVARGLEGHTPEWYGWANAVTSELLPTSAFLSIQQRKRQGRSTTVPSWIFTGAFTVSLLAQLSATGISIPYAAEFLAMLPALAVLILSKVIFGDIEHAEQARVDERKRAERAAEQQRRKAEQAAEQAAELAAARERTAAELAAAMAREAREHEAQIELQRIAAEQAGITERARIEADTARRQAEREAEDRRRREAAARDLEAAERERVAAAEREWARIAAEADAEARRIKAAADAALVEAQAERVAAEAEAKRVAAAALAAAGAQAGSDVDEGGEGGGRRKRSAAETQALVDAVLETLADGTTRDVAVKTVAASLKVSAEYARRFVPAGWVKGASSADHEEQVPSAAGRRGHLAVVGSAASSG